MDRTLERAEWSSYPQRKAQSEARGLMRGIGLANPIERAGSPAPEYARISLDAQGHTTVRVGTKNHGQGHETMYLQILGSELGLNTDDVTLVDGDTSKVAKGVGTFGSRSAMTGGTAVKLASAKLVERGRAFAAQLLGTDQEAVAFRDFKFSAGGKAYTLEELARAYHADGAKDGEFADEMTWAAPDCTFPYGTHVCEVEIDPETGVTEIVKYTVFDDVGNPINPLLIKGQVYGGIVQGAGQILLENMIYDASGQCVTGSFTDYAMPRAKHFCHFDVSTFVTVTERNPLGVKGAGEAGAVGAMAAVSNAIVDALSPLGIQDFEMPATPARIWETIQAAKVEAV
jgi:carbon-monoxide dehydrogenase large subunit